MGIGDWGLGIGDPQSPKYKDILIINIKSKNI